MNLETVYLDLDGVIADFNKKYEELFHVSPTKDSVKEHWEAFVKTRQFENIELIPGSLGFLEELENLSDVYKFSIVILTSAGGLTYYDLVRQQKINWLESHGIDFRAIVVQSKKFKENYAKKHAKNSSVLIDDTETNVLQFVSSGGLGVHHVTHQKSLEDLRKILRTK